VARQQEDVALALAQRRHDEPVVGQAVEEISAEAAVLHAPAEVHVRGAQDPHVGPPCRGLAEPLVLLLLQEAQQPHLRERGHVCHFVDEERAALGLGDVAVAGAERAREGPLGDAEQLGAEELVREAGDVHRHEAPAATG
jgi:hypothetical protein